MHTDNDVFMDLLPDEIWWRDHQRFLQSRGYLLRSRYHSGWVPSWKDTDKEPEHCEDSLESLFDHVLDAQRLSDGKIVFLKRVCKAASEVKIAQSLTTPIHLRDYRNHCVPILDYFMDDLDEEYAFIVMPLLRRFNDPPFSFVSEVIDFITQTLEALVFIHEQGVAHRDLSDLNIMFDAMPLYPGGFHPIWQSALPTGTGLAKPMRRIDVPSVRYYIIDFGISSRFEDPSTPHLVTGTNAQDRDVPELSDVVPYDPFAVDIFTLGNLYKRVFVNVYSNLWFVSPVVNAMTQPNPESRPTAASALSQFRVIVSGQCGMTLRWHLQTSGESMARQASQSIGSAGREVVFLLTKFTGNPFGSGNSTTPLLHRHHNMKKIGG